MTACRQIWNYFTVTGKIFWWWKMFVREMWWWFHSLHLYLCLKSFIFCALYYTIYCTLTTSVTLWKQKNSRRLNGKTQIHEYFWKAVKFSRPSNCNFECDSNDFSGGIWEWYRAKLVGSIWKQATKIRIWPKVWYFPQGSRKIR